MAKPSILSRITGGIAGSLLVAFQAHLWGAEFAKSGGLADIPIFLFGAFIGGLYGAINGAIGGASKEIGEVIRHPLDTTLGGDESFLKRNEKTIQ
jgi:hypothetical protein